MRRWRRRRCRSTTRPAPMRGSPSTPGAPGTARSRSASEHGYRNAQASVIAPTGTIGLVMDCDTTGIEPDFALVKFKKLAGGGYFKIINRAVPAALRALGYGESEIADDRRLCRRPRRARRGAGDQPRDAQGQGLHARGDREGREGAADRLRHQVRLQQVDAGRGFLPRRARRRAGRSRRAEFRPARRTSASPGARSTPPTSMSAAP